MIVRTTSPQLSKKSSSNCSHRFVKSGRIEIRLRERCKDRRACNWNKTVGKDSNLLSSKRSDVRLCNDAIYTIIQNKTLLLHQEVFLSYWHSNLTYVKDNLKNMKFHQLNSTCCRLEEVVQYLQYSLLLRFRRWYEYFLWIGELYTRIDTHSNIPPHKWQDCAIILRISKNIWNFTRISDNEHFCDY